MLRGQLPCTRLLSAYALHFSRAKLQLNKLILRI